MMRRCPAPKTITFSYLYSKYQIRLIAKISNKWQ
jgi:hypothetical protein